MRQKTRPIEELEYMFLLALLVAGKNARVAHAALERLLAPIRITGERPLQYLKRLHAESVLESELRAQRTGQYTKILRCLTTYWENEFDLQTCDIDDLEALPGIGPKSSRFFLMYSRPGYRCAVLDVHILRFMRRHGINTPKHTPQNREKYKELEAEYLELAERLGVDPTQLDDAVWREGAGWLDD